MPSASNKPPSLWQPSQWPLAFGLGVLRVGAMLPLPLAQGLGRGLGILAFAVLPSRRRIVRRNLELCFPAWSSEQRDRMVRANFAATGMGLMDTALAWWRDDAWLAAHVRIQGLEHYHAAHAAGKGVLVLGAHFTPMEMGGRIAAKYFPISTVYKAAKNPVFNAFMYQQRAKSYKRLIANDNMRGLLAHLREGGTCWYGIDQDFGIEQGVFAPFFGIPTATLTLASKILQRTGAKVFFSYPERLPKASGYVLHIVPVENFPSGDVLQDATAYNRMIEAVVRMSPENYFWLHRRFKTRPPGETNPYD